MKYLKEKSLKAIRSHSSLNLFLQHVSQEFNGVLNDLQKTQVRRLIWISGFQWMQLDNFCPLSKLKRLSFGLETFQLIKNATTGKVHTGDLH